MRFVSLLALTLVACGSSSTNDAGESTSDASADAPVEGAAASDAGDASIADAAPDASDAARELRRCRTSGAGGVAGDVCWLLTPAESGLPATGVNAGVDQYALRPAAGAPERLVVFFNGSGGSPAAGARGSTTESFYATARALGLHVFGVSYRSDDSIGGLCKRDDACFLPTRRTILTGRFEVGADPSLAGIALHEGALARLYAGLRTLAELDATGGWDAFLDASATAPADRIRWSKIVAAGHSQGGGHAALVGRTFAVDRVVLLSSPCDQTATGPASWLDASAAAFATSPATAYRGLGAPSDPICPAYADAWTALGLDPSSRRADATVCAGAGAHSATIECVENAPTWAAMLE